MQDSSSSGNVLVTGATGFIGQHLVATLLRSRGAIFALARDPARLKKLWPAGIISARRGDLGDPDSLAGACLETDRVFHLAGYAHADGEQPQDIDRHWRITVEGTKALIAEAVRAGVKTFVFASTVKTMGEGSITCLDESSPARPVTPYGRAKLEAERLVLEAGRRHGMHVCSLRFPLVYGRDNRGNIWRMISAIDHGRFPPLPETNNKRSMVHVDDVIQALWLAAENPGAKGQTYIVTDSRVYSTHQICAAVYKALGRQAPRWTIPIGLLRVAARMGDAIGKIRGRGFFFDSGVLDKLTGSACYNCQKIKTELGYQPTRFLEDGLREMVDEYNKSGRL